MAAFQLVLRASFKNVTGHILSVLNVLLRKEAAISDLASQSDEKLMELYQQGEYAAFEELYFRHSGRLYGYVRSRISKANDADDLLQFIFLKLHQSRFRYDSKVPFLPWIFTISHHAVIDHYRKNRSVTEDPEKITSRLEQMGLGNLGNDNEPPLWQEVLANLPINERELIELRFNEGLKFEEIAQRLGINESSARKRVSRTVGRLRALFLEKNKGDES